ncbi:MAG: hypothetical protein IKT44_01280 [Clostridia bacterium]|nr:hypothetical protein [Clostridia bacterium]
MDSNMIERYKNQMLEMYNATQKVVPAQTNENSIPQPQTPQPTPDTTSGNLIGIVTAVRALYPVKNAKVTVFTGEYDNLNVIDTDLTDQSGRTKTFVLPTPEKALSLEETNTVLPYALYNMLIEADGYIKNIHLNIPVFSGVTSLQQTNLLLEETAGTDKGPQIFDEAQKYDL